LKVLLAAQVALSSFDGNVSEGETGSVRAHLLPDDRGAHTF